MRYEGTNYAPFWSRDGKYLAYASRRGPENSKNVLVIRSLETGQERDLSPNAPAGVVLLRNAWEEPRWSPDGSSILLTAASRKRGPSVYLLDPETGNIKLILPDEQEKEGPKYTAPHCPVFSNDGRQIFYTSYRRIVVRNLETREDRLLYESTSNLGRLALSPDGRRLAFTAAAQPRRHNAVMTISTSGGEARELYTLEKGKSFTPGVGITWTPDGRHIVVGGPVADGPDAPDKSDSTELLIIPVAGGEPRTLDLGMKIGDFFLHPDGQRIGFTYFDPKGGSEVWVMENFLP